MGLLSSVGSQIERNQAQTEQLKKQGKLTDAQIDQVVKTTDKLTYEIALLIEQKKNVKLNNDQLAEVNKTIGERIRKTIEKIDVDTRRGQEELNNLMTYGTPTPNISNPLNALTLGVIDTLWPVR